MSSPRSTWLAAVKEKGIEAVGLPTEEMVEMYTITDPRYIELMDLAKKQMRTCQSVEERQEVLRKLGAGLQSVNERDLLERAEAYNKLNAGLAHPMNEGQ